MKIVVFSNLHGVGPAIKNLVEGHSLDSTVWDAADASQLLQLLSSSEPTHVMVGERGLFQYLPLESQLFGIHLPPYKRMVISYLSPSSTELWGAELGFDGMIDGAEGAESMLKKLRAVDDGENLLRSNPAFQPPIAFDSTTSTVIRYADDIDEKIVILIAAGLEDAEIAERVFLSLQELRKRIHRLITSANIRNRTQLAVLHSRGLTEFAV